MPESIFVPNEVYNVTVYIFKCMWHRKTVHAFKHAPTSLYDLCIHSMDSMHCVTQAPIMTEYCLNIIYVDYKDIVL